jgi:hypothetical protein
MLALEAMSLPLPIGITDFRELREKKLTYVDKSGLLIDMIDMPGVKVLLLPRPRRFGKTLNLSMLRYFFERRAEDLSHLFADLAVWQAGEAYRAHFQRYPVIYLTFRDVKSSSFEECRAALQKKIEALFREHKALLESGVIDEGERRDYQAILDGTAEPVLYHRALGDLSMYLHRATGERTIILIDEYDQPIHAGYVNGFAREILDFFRVFLTIGLKDNPHLERGVITGILRIARESIFSGLNNLGVFTILRSNFATAFGFTEPEVVDLLARAGQSDALAEAQRWYNGYCFSGHIIYNPWSVLSFLVDANDPAQPYWLNTSDNALIKQLLKHHAPRLHTAFEDLMAGRGVERTLDENVVLEDLEHDEDALWSLLVFSGYLNAEEKPRLPGARRSTYRLSIPNEEVHLVYTDTFHEWMQARLRSHGGDLRRFVQALLEGDAEILHEELQALALSILSYHDTGGARPETLYHGFVLGLLAVLEPEYTVRSNRESGKGRPDVLIAPRQPGRPGVVMELKVARPGKKTLDQALDEGTRQLTENDYQAELDAAGAAPIHSLVIAFDGKEVRVRNLASPDQY